MKSIGKSGITLLLALFSSFLFYKESIGVNIFVFTVLSAMAVLFLNPKASYKQLLYIIPAFLSSLFIAIYPQSLTFIIWIVSYVLMWSAISVKFVSILQILQGFVSIVTSPIHQFKKCLSPSPELIEEPKSIKSNKSIYAITSIIVIVFAFLYVQSNPMVSSIVSGIDLSFIDAGYIYPTVFSYCLLFGLVQIKKSSKLNRFNSKPFILNKTQLGDREESEFKIARLSLIIVATLLSVINLMDLVVLFTGKLPQNMTYSAYVHQGFNTLIFTMSLAVGLIIYFYRGQVNYHKKVNVLRKASYFWVMQNIVLAVITCCKNMMYVEAYGLTYKRIAVFLFLICIVIGLVLSIKKIKQPLTNWHYFNQLYKYAFVSIFCISLLPFDMIITDYNLKYSDTKDINYLLTLSKPDYMKMQNVLDLTDLDFNTRSAISQRSNELFERANSVSWKSWSLYLHTYALSTDN